MKKTYKTGTPTKERKYICYVDFGEFKDVIISTWRKENGWNCGEQVKVLAWDNLPDFEEE